MAKGCIQAEVLPLPTAPKMAMPVYSPRSGMVSHSGFENLPGFDRMMHFTDDDFRAVLLRRKRPNRERPEGAKDPASAPQSKPSKRTGQ